MIDEDWFDRHTPDVSAAGSGKHIGQLEKTSINGWQIAGVCLLFFLLSPALVRGTAQDWANSLGLTLISSPLLAWLFLQMRQSDDLFDEANRRREELIDTLAIVLLWTWPWTYCVPLLAVVRFIHVLSPCGL